MSSGAVVERGRTALLPYPWRPGQWKTLNVDLPDGVTPDMLAALQRGEDVRLPDGRRVCLVRAYSPLSGESGPFHVEVFPVESSGPPSVRLSPYLSGMGGRLGGKP